MKLNPINADKRIVIVRTNRIDEEIRVPKEIDILIKSGYDITLINWDKKGTNSNTNKLKYKEIQLKLKVSSKNMMFFYVFIWWIFVFSKLMTTEWDSVHAVNFQSQLPSLVVAKIKKRKVIYELLDIIELSNSLSKIIRSFFLKFDKKLMKYSDAIIVADEMQITGLGGIPNSNIIALYDSPSVSQTHSIVTQFDRSKEKKNFTLFYAGELYKVRKLNLDKLFQAILSLDGVNLIIAGSGDLIDEIKIWESDFPGKIRFMGRISYQKVIETGLMADLFFVLRDSRILSNKYTCGSTLFNAMICGKPILANKGSSTANIVKNENCGLVLDADNIDEIKEAIIKLKNDPKLCKELGANALKAYEKKYNWQIMGNKLSDLYKNLI